MQSKTLNKFIGCYRLHDHRIHELKGRKGTTYTLPGVTAGVIDTSSPDPPDEKPPDATIALGENGINNDQRYQHAQLAAAYRHKVISQLHSPGQDSTVRQSERVKQATKNSVSIYTYRMLALL